MKYGSLELCKKLIKTQTLKKFKVYTCQKIKKMKGLMRPLREVLLLLIYTMYVGREQEPWFKL